jgi:hypothetical protein
MSVMAIEKKLLSFEDIEAQTALELPDRETLATVVFACLAVCVGQIQIRNVDITVEVLEQVCAQINVQLAVLSGANQTVTCTLR